MLWERDLMSWERDKYFFSYVPSVLPYETSIGSAIFSSCAFLCKIFFDILMQLLDYLSLM